jgi:hypothetical protein
MCESDSHITVTTDSLRMPQLSEEAKQRTDNGAASVMLSTARTYMPWYHTYHDSTDECTVKDMYNMIQESGVYKLTQLAYKRGSKAEVRGLLACIYSRVSLIHGLIKRLFSRSCTHYPRKIMQAINHGLRRSSCALSCRESAH